MAEPFQKVPWWIKAIVTALLAIGGTMFTSSHFFNKQVDLEQQSSITSRVTNLEVGQQKLEAHQQDDHEKLQYIQNQVDKLVEWALGHK